MLNLRIEEVLVVVVRHIIYKITIHSSIVEEVEVVVQVLPTEILNIIIILLTAVIIILIITILILIEVGP